MVSCTQVVIVKVDQTPARETIARRICDAKEFDTLDEKYETWVIDGRGYGVTETRVDESGKYFLIRKVFGVCLCKADVMNSLISLARKNGCDAVLCRASSDAHKKLYTRYGFITFDDCFGLDRMMALHLDPRIEEE